jgi:ribonuclease Z
MGTLIRKFLNFVHLKINMDITFLGTTCMVPTKERNPVANFISYEEEGILVDCGEGTQRQMRIAGIKPTKVTIILISHWHGDHVIGLPGLIQTLGASEYSRTLNIYGPPGTKDHFNAMFDAFVFDNKIEMEVHEIKEGVFLKKQDFQISALKLDHRIDCYGFRFEEADRRRIKIDVIKKLGIPEGPLLGKLQDGKSIVFKGKKVTPEDTTTVVKGKIVAIIADTLLCNNCYRLAQDADLLICEAAFSSKLEDKAQQYFHLTAKQAANIASHSNVKKLVLTHFSARYKNTSEIQEDAQQLFDDVTCAEDFMKIDL